MRHLQFTIALVVLAIGTLACGKRSRSHGSSHEESPPPAPRVSTESPTTNDADSDSTIGSLSILLAGQSLPKCDVGTQGKIYYSPDSNKFSYCQGGNWLDLNVSGPSGIAGKRGDSTLVRMTQEPIGANCANGGTRLEAGADLDADATLDQSEVTATSFICNGTQGSVGIPGSPTLAISSQILPGDSICSAGGQLLMLGTDDGRGSGVANSGTLEAGEVTQQLRVCNGANGSNGSQGFNSLVRVTSEPAGMNCRAGGQKTEVGLDNGDGGAIERDGNLSPSEVDATSYLCPADFKLYRSDGTQMGWVRDKFEADAPFPYKSLALESFDGTQVTLYYTHNPQGLPNNVSSRAPRVAHLEFLAFKTNDCTGQPYMWKIDDDAKNLRNLYGPKARLTLIGDIDFTFDLDVFSTETYHSRLTCGGSCNTLSDLICNPDSGHSGGWPVTLTPRTFDRFLSEGWRISL